MQRGLDAFRGGALRLQHALGEESRAAERKFVAQPGSGVVLDELHRAAAGEERADHFDAEPGKLRQDRLEVGFRKRQRQHLHEFAAAGTQAVAETLARFLAGGIVPGDPARLLHALCRQRLAHAVGRLPVAERGTEDRRRAQFARGGDVAGVRDDQRHLAFARGLHQRHHHAGMHGADQHIDLVAFQQAVDVLRRLRGIGLVIEPHQGDGAPA